MSVAAPPPLFAEWQRASTSKPPTRDTQPAHASREVRVRAQTPPQTHREESREEEPATPPADTWTRVSDAVAGFFEASHRAESRKRKLRDIVDTVVDPLGLSKAAKHDPLASFGVESRCEGDERLRRVQEMLDSFAVERHDTQRLWHWHIIAAVLPIIYDKDWPRACNRVLKSMGIIKLKREVLIMTSRRAGKTWSVAMILTAILLCCPGKRIVVVSTGGRASGNVMLEVLRFVSQIPGAARRICSNSGERLYIAEHPLPMGIGLQSAYARSLRTSATTSMLEVLPDNPKEAWHSGPVALDEEKHGSWVIVNDTLTWLHRLMGSYSLDALLGTIVGRYLQPLRESPVSYVVICTDESSRVPLEKRRVQIKRSVSFHRRGHKRVKARAEGDDDDEPIADEEAEPETEEARMLRESQEDARKPYPEAARLCSEGVCYVHPRTGLEVKEAVDVPRLLHHRVMRDTLWGELVRYLRSDRVDIPAHRALILDHFAEGPWVFTSDGARLRSDLKHEFGEGEMMCIYWSCVFDKYACVIDTIDTDLMPLAVHYLSNTHPAREKPLIWRYDTTCHVDLRVMTDCIHRRWVCSSLDFMVGFILSGTDYFEKGQVLMQLGCMKILHGVQACANHVAQILDDGAGIAHYKMLLRFLYNDYMTSRVSASKAINSSGALRAGDPLPTLDALREQCAEKNYKSFRVASEEVIRETYDTLLKHIYYWSMDTRRIPRAHKLPRPLLSVADR